MTGFVAATAHLTDKDGATTAADTDRPEGTTEHAEGFGTQENRATATTPPRSTSTNSRNRANKGKLR